MSRPSTPSDSSVLALQDFTYGRGDHAVEYPHGHDESQPQTPVSPSTSRRSHARAYSLSLIDRGLASPHPRQGQEDAMSGGEENTLGLTVIKETENGHMDPFTAREITIMAGSSFMVLALIGIAATLTLGKFTL